MDLDQIGSVDTSSSILFLGSGFSTDATNQKGDSPPNGKELKYWIERQLGFKEATDYDLRILADELADRGADSFARELKDIFRITRISDEQDAILSQDWRRIYTTNYDDAVELYRREKKLTPNSYDISDNFPGKLPNGSVIHLHGSVRLIQSHNLRSSIVLGERSYVDQLVHESRWYDQFLRDIAFSDHVFFLGYSLSDYLISSLLTQNPSTARKTIFVVKGEINPIEKNRVKPYGEICAVGLEGFASWLKRVPRRTAATDLNSLKAFRALNPSRDKKAFREATAPEVYDMLVYGNFDPGRLASSLPGQSYVSERVAPIQEAITALNEATTVLIDSRIGNGKTIFLHLLAAELSQKNFACFLFRPGHPDLNQEIKALADLRDVVIFFERYGDAEDSLPDLASALPSAKFVSEIRTALFEVRFHDLKRVTAGAYKRVSLNPLSQTDRSNILALARRAGIPVEKSAVQPLNELRDILISIFHNNTVRERIKRELLPLFQSQNLKRILACATLLGRNHTKFGLELLRAIYRFDPFEELRDTDGLSTEIFEFDMDGFRMRSALLSEFLLHEYVDPDEVADAAARLVRYSAERKDIRTYRALMGELMAFGNLYPAFGSNDSAVARIIGLYEDLRFDERINDEPLFWLQFAIASVENGRLDLAISYISTAYERAEDLEGFQTYQIDTQAFRIYLLKGTSQSDGEVEDFDRILELLEIVEDMLREDSHRYHAVKVMENVQPFVSARVMDFSEAEKVALVFRLSQTVRTLRELPMDFRARTGADLVAARINDANELLARKKH